MRIVTIAYTSSHLSKMSSCLIGCLLLEHYFLCIYCVMLCSISTHHFESLYNQKSLWLWTAYSVTQTANTSI